jgi:anti-sigma factor RsiW
VDREIAASHFRSLMTPGHLMDVASTDQHTVKPWFDGKVDFAPPVKDLAEQGFPLTGGRLDYVAGQPAAALVFKRQQHIINLFIWPNSNVSDASETATTERGFHLVHWTRGGMNFWAVSDLNEKELLDFARLFQAGL